MKFREAIHSATILSMERNPAIFLIGVGVADPRGVYGTVLGARQRWPQRVLEGPLAENTLTGMCVGAATLGLRPHLIHHRMDFVLLSLDQIINHAAKWRQMFGDQQTVPMVIRAVVGRGWGNGPQHTQSHHGLFARIPGLQVVVPSNPYDAKGLLLAALESDDPVIYIEHRWLHEDEAMVPAGYYTVPLGKADVVRQGKDVTVAAVGTMVPEALKAADALDASGISTEVIDMRTIRPLDMDTVFASVAKTGRLVAADADWGPCGVASEIVAQTVEHRMDRLKGAPRRVTWPDSAVPMSQPLEIQYYPGAKQISEAVLQACKHGRSQDIVASTIKPFEGPF